VPAGTDLCLVWGMNGVVPTVAPGCVVSAMISLLAERKSFSSAARTRESRAMFSVKSLHLVSHFVSFSQRFAFSVDSVVAVSYQNADLIEVSFPVLPRRGAASDAVDFVSVLLHACVSDAVLAAIWDSRRHRRLLIALKPAAMSCNEQLAAYFCVSRVAVRVGVLFITVRYIRQIRHVSGIHATVACVFLLFYVLS
jgi:hypothetical protein